MKNIKLSDITLRECDREGAAKLSFKEKQETAKLLESLNVDVIETGYAGKNPADAVFIRMLAGTLEQTVLCVPVPASKESIDETWAALSKAKQPRLNLIVPTSTVAMEYSLSKKPDDMQNLIPELIAYAKTLCDDIELTCDDATRSDPGFLAQVLSSAIAAGAKTITLCDGVGDMLPEEAAEFIKAVKTRVPGLDNITLAFHCLDSIGLACACALSCVKAGVSLLKVSSGDNTGTLSLESFLGILKERGEALELSCGLNTVSYSRVCDRLRKITAFTNTRTRTGTSDDKAGKSIDTADINFTDIGGLREYTRTIGYEISEEDLNRIFIQYKEISRNKSVVSDDIEALIAETAGQAPPVYQLGSFVINSGSAITATAYIELIKDGEVKTALCAGDGPIDAAFKATESIVGRRYELEDFQIHAVTGGREATGDTLIKIRYEGRLYSGRGVSTDIVGAGIRAYLSAVNKILSEG